MSLRVGQRVKGRASGTVGEIRARCPMHPHSWYVLPDGGCTTQCWPEDIFTPLPEPERVKGWCNKPEGQTCVDEPASSYCDMALRCGWWVRRPVPHSYASRLSLITYPELFICEKAGECSGPCIVGRPHERVGQRCHEGPCYMFPGVRHCIPYVPEDEGREWFVVAKDTGAWVDGSGLLDTKERALELIRARQRHNLRAFKWSDGLKGAPCE